MKPMMTLPVSSLKIVKHLLLLAAAFSLITCSSKIPSESGILDVRPEKLHRGDRLIIEGEPYLAPSPQVMTLRAAPAFLANVKATRVIQQGSFSPLRR